MSANRRKHSRYVLPTGYTPIAVRYADADEFTLGGHAYNISQGGICFELDQPVTPGTQVGMMVTLPEGSSAVKRAVFVLANIVWVGDVEEPGPVEHAAAFHLFPRVGDEDLLRAALKSGRYAMAA
jgi:hypothetical protein